jgi:glyoxylase-like metal-dependent hydrolase (beta-lactamase superfamily II)
MNTEHVIASFLLLGADSAALVETGPTSCIEHLTGGLKNHGVSPEDVQRVFLTHIHLDHAGASGHLAGLLPNATFYVHEVGYPHLVDPSKLLKSATRIYGEKMDELWGEARPVPEDRLEVLEGGEELEAAGGVLAAHYTPGHAYHHLAYLDPSSGAFFTGDVGGIRQIGPQSLYLTHFGRFDDTYRHLAEFEQRLQDWVLFVGERMDGGMERDEIAGELRTKGDAEMLAEGASSGESEHYDLAGDYPTLVDGLMRYVSKRRKSD